jgi:hypothetical protein
MVFPTVVPPNHDFVPTWICTISGNFCVNLSFPGFVVSWEDFKMTPPYCCIFVIISIWGDLALDLYNLKFSLPKDHMYQVWLKLVWFWRRFLKIFSNTKACKNGFPHCGPTRPPVTTICTNLSLHYIRML